MTFVCLAIMFALNVPMWLVDGWPVLIGIYILWVISATSFIYNIRKWKKAGKEYRRQMTEYYRGENRNSYLN